MLLWTFLLISFTYCWFSWRTSNYPFSCCFSAKWSITQARGWKIGMEIGIEEHQQFPCLSGKSVVLFVAQISGRFSLKSLSMWTVCLPFPQLSALILWDRGEVLTCSHHMCWPPLGKPPHGCGKPRWWLERVWKNRRENLINSPR